MLPLRLMPYMKRLLSGVAEWTVRAVGILLGLAVIAFGVALATETPDPSVEGGAFWIIVGGALALWSLEY